MSTAIGEQAVLRLIQSKRATSQIELARVLDLPANTIHGVVKRLESEGFIAEERQERGSRGRPSRHFAIRLPGRVLVIIWWGTEWQGTIIGEDVGGESEIVYLSSPAVPDIKTASNYFLKIRDSVLAKKKLQVKDLDGAIVMINSGRVTGGVALASSVVPQVKDLSEEYLSKLLGCETLLSAEPHLAELELRNWVRDDVRSLVHFNVADGASAHYAAMVGAGIYVIPGQVGHVMRQSDGEICGCGNRGCLETLIAGPRLIRKIRHEIESGVSSSLSLSLKKTPSDIFNNLEEADREGRDPYARTVVRDFLDHCAWGISVAINMFQPDIVVLSGYTLAGRKTWLDRIAEILPSRVLGSDQVSLRLEFGRQIPSDHLRELATEFFMRKKFSLDTP